MSRDEDFQMSVVIDTPTGPLELEDPDAGYELHGDCFAQTGVTVNRTMVSNRWLEGEYAVDAVRGNTTEALVVWVSGSDHYEWYLRLKAVTDALLQLSYRVTRTLGPLREVWDCSVSDGWSIETSADFIHATSGVLRVPLVRRPQAVVSRVVDDTVPGWWAAMYVPKVLGLRVAVGAPRSPAQPMVLAGLGPL